MGYRYTDFFCPTTDCTGKKMIMHDRKEEVERPECRLCGAVMLKGFPAPTVMRASFAEGQERGERWTMLKQSAKLEQQASHLRKNGKKEEAGEMKQESQKLKQRANNKRDKTDV